MTHFDDKESDESSLLAYRNLIFSLTSHVTFIIVHVVVDMLLLLYGIYYTNCLARKLGYPVTKRKE